MVSGLPGRDSPATSGVDVSKNLEMCATLSKSIHLIIDVDLGLLNLLLMLLNDTDGTWAKRD
jgi:hypothetical protein